MLTMCVATTRIDAPGLGWEEVLPAKIFGSRTDFSGKALWQPGYAISIPQFGRVDFPNFVHLVLQFAEQGFGDEHGAVFVSFPESNVDQAALDINAGLWNAIVDRRQPLKLRHKDRFAAGN